MYDNWEELENSLKDCNKCKLCSKRKNIVFEIEIKYNKNILFKGNLSERRQTDEQFRLNLAFDSIITCKR